MLVTPILAVRSESTSRFRLSQYELLMIYNMHDQQILAAHVVSFQRLWKYILGDIFPPNYGNMTESENPFRLVILKTQIIV